MACTVIGELVGVYQRLLALGGIAVGGFHLQILLVELISLVKLLLKAAHLGQIKVQLALGILVSVVGEALVNALGTRVVIHQAVALCQLEVHTVLLGFIVLNLLVGLLILLGGIVETVLVKEVVGLLGDTLLSIGAGSHKQCGNEQYKTLFERFHIYISISLCWCINITINSLHSLFRPSQCVVSMC